MWKQKSVVFQKLLFIVWHASLPIFFSLQHMLLFKNTSEQEAGWSGATDGEMLVMGRPPKQDEEVESLRYVRGSSFRFQASRETVLCTFWNSEQFSQHFRNYG